MSDEFDPIENWLGTDIELLPPPAGSFERVHRRARRRKAVVAMSAAAGVAVVIAAAATVPQLSMFQPNNSGPNRVEPITSSSSPARPSRTPSATPKSSHSSTAAPPGPSNLAITGSTVPPTPGIAPSSVTFVSGNVGAVIGETTSGCPSGCVAVAGTASYGRSWTKADAPPAGPANGDTGVSQIRFLQPPNGWAFGPQLYATGDGGATWKKVSGLPGRVIDLATVGGSAFAVVASCVGGGGDYATGCTSFALYSSPYNADDWKPVPGARGQYPVVPGGLQLTSQNGYLLAGSALFTGPPSGGPWRQVAIRSAVVPFCLSSKSDKAGPGASGLLAPGPSSQVYLLCQQTGSSLVLLYQSADAGASWQIVGPVKARGTATSLAVAPTSGTLVLATSNGIYYSPDTRHWRAASLPGSAPAGGFGFAGMTTPSHGVALAAGRGSRVIYVTIDGGRTWHARPIS